MKYTFCEKLMWHALTPTLFQWLKRREPGWELPALKRESKRTFGEMVERTPEIGSMKENSLRVCLSAGIVWLSVYEAAEVELGRDADEYTIRYSQCGLCALGKQEGLEHLIPYTCALDILSVEWMGGVLYRTKTLATGGDCCDFYICRKGSKWEKEKKR